ncbi:hypothetical protein FJU75_14435 [Acinetobacter baumannii]|uniref:hypothetical protein n=1 Tax=Acinetobacter baumannii TaxID=470 RepID=UPI00112A6441|nr:hypothetical protein [Acinetobacter baumannii]TPT06532.1 hypothetical protein FJU75_14435 [Acinetobacter baumannii]
MTDLNKEREAFAQTEFNTFGLDVKDFKTTGEYFMFIGWLMRLELEKAKAQTVLESFEIGRLKDRITELLDERQDLYAQINSAPDVTNNHVVIPKECPDPIFADALFNYLRSKSYTEEKGFEYIYLSDIDETEVWNFVVKASESGAEQ